MRLWESLCEVGSDLARPGESSCEVSSHLEKMRGYVFRKDSEGWAAGERGGSAGGGSGSRLLRRSLIIIIETIRTLRGAAEPLMVE